ncbi:MAG: type III-B CRISPR module RAMP protein Cmr4 [Oscillatoria sp. PMC 1068.18]|nr:type III-B CRISPR module RAMP protein Cmr4 [Oscillatoria sp. PMC 1076.18]MEC4987118.1 type III-B CRISPR module RAMP protein Cmr4 [Oscillatoria sp. PMC 1068.18]
MKTNLAYLYLLSPLHTGGTTQEGNLVGIAREVHTDLPYLPSSTIRGRLRAATPEARRNKLWGNTIDDVTNGKDDNLKQGSLWVSDAAILWFPIPSLSHGVVWITCPLLLQRWARFVNPEIAIPEIGCFSGGNQANLYLRDTIFKTDNLRDWQREDYSLFIPNGCRDTNVMTQFLVLSNHNCRVLIESSLWRQVKVTLDSHKSVKGGFRYEEAIPPETLMYFPWGTTVANNNNVGEEVGHFRELINQTDTCQIGGQESLGRGIVRLWLTP